VSNDGDDEAYDASKPTPQMLRRQPRYAMSPAEREGGAHRRAVTEGERRRHAELYASGMPVVAPEQEEGSDTGPVATMEAIELDADDLQQVDRLRRDSPNPYVALYKLTKLNRQLRHEVRTLRTDAEAFDRREQSNNQERADQILELLNRPPHEDVAEMQRDMSRLASTLSKLEREFAPIRSFSKWALGVAGAAALAIAIFLYQRGFGEGGNSVRMELLEKTVGKLEGEIGRLERLFYSDTKGHAP
jgi:hypothetical protein